MAQLKSKWIENGAITAEKIDSTQSYYMEGLIIDSTNVIGKIGIGTTNPQDPIHIRRLSASVGVLLDLDDGTNGRSYRLFTDSVGNLKIDDLDAVATRFTINSGGTVIIAGDSTVSGNFAVQGTTTLINTDVIVTDELEINQSANRSALIAVQDGGAGNTATVVKIENNSSGHALTVDSGNVGIGTTNPDQNLTVIGNIRSSSVISASSNIDSTGNLTANGNVISSTGNIYTLTGDILSARDMTAVSGNIVAPSGNLGAGGNLGITGSGIIGGSVGIGTLVPDPTSKLHVEGHIVGINGTSNLGSTTRRFANLYLASGINYSSNLLFDSGGTKLTLTTAGALISVSDMTSSGGNITANGNLTAVTGNIIASAGTLSVASTSTLSGLVGIGTAPATYNLRVQGTSYMSGNVNIGGTFNGGQINCSNITVTGGGVSASSGTISGAIISGGSISGSGLSITGPYNIGRYFEFSRTGVNIVAWTGQVDYNFTLSSSDTGGHIEAYVSGYWNSSKSTAGYNRFLGSFWLQSNILLSNNVILNEFDDSGMGTTGLTISLFAMGSNVLRVRISNNNPQRFDGVMVIRFLLDNGTVY